MMTALCLWQIMITSCVSGDIENYGNNGRGPVWWYPMEKMYSDDNRPSEGQLEDLKCRLLEELEKLI